MPALPLGREWIAARLPHKGSMCLLDTLLACDEDSIRCSAATHRAADNPLRAHGRLGAACAIEYAAQAIALHGAVQGAASAPGMLAAVRDVTLHVATLEQLPAPLDIECQRLAGDARTLLYRFAVSCAGQAVATGRATVVIGLPGASGT